MAAMGVCPLLVVLGCMVLTAGSLASAQSNMLIIHSPDYLHFKKDAGPLATSEIGRLILATFGHSLREDLKWSGLEQGNMFHRPKANVLLSIEGVMSIDAKHVAKFPINVDESIVDMTIVSNKLGERIHGYRSFIVDFTENDVLDIKSRYPKQLSTLPINLSEMREHLVGDRSAFTTISPGSLNMTNDVDAAFLGEIQLIHEVISALKLHKSLVKDIYPDLFNFRVTGMHRLVDTYGTGSKQVVDAHYVLESFINNMTEDLKALYGGHVMIEVLTLLEVDSRKLSRKTRSLMEADQTAGLGKYNLESDYTGDYAAIFNIILWTVVFLGLIVAGVSYSMWTMDPGRDSIIYRMTTQRMKKD